ncbi:MAG: phospholipid carrier-dependent glycosyltransferase [Anaerolineaceae bacterium]|nr:phospholipid carrier-dependent glycosyltransferase [Anaerolineaceae bacterium]
MPKITGQFDNFKENQKTSWIWASLIIVILLAGAYFRTIGANWDENQHLHPDERFLTMVETSIQPVENIKAYFDTEHSTLNPHNQGYGFYVYGTLPLFTVRYLAEWFGKTGYGEVFLVGRTVSAFFDLLTVFLVFLTALKLYKNTKLGLLAAGFSALAVLQIQLSHYFTVDIFANFFTFLAFYFAICILPDEKGEDDSCWEDCEGEKVEQQTNIAFEEKNNQWLKNWKSLLPYAFFGIALGMAVSSKISSFPIFILLPGAALINYFSFRPEDRKTQWSLILRNLIIAGIISIIVFRIFQPYAFSGPGFFGLKPNEQWVANMQEISVQSKGDVDFPPALQWARRPLTFAWENMVQWGLGLPLGLLAWSGFLWMGWRLIRGEWKKHILLWCWTGVFFIWQSLNFTRSMRYQIPIYPTLAIIASWMIFALWKKGEQRVTAKKINWYKIISVGLGTSVLLATLIYAFAFTRIYSISHTRVEASRWIYQNVPGAINLQIEDSNSGTLQQPLAVRQGKRLSLDEPILIKFIPTVDGRIQDITFAHLVDLGQDDSLKNLIVLISEDENFSNPLTGGMLTEQFAADGDSRGREYVLYFDRQPDLEAGETYYILIQVPDTGVILNVNGSMAIRISSSEVDSYLYLPEPIFTVRLDSEYRVQFDPIGAGELRSIYLPNVVDWGGHNNEKTLRLSIYDQSQGGEMVASTEITAEFLAENDPRGEAYKVMFSENITLFPDHSYSLGIRMVNGLGEIAIYGSKHTNESTWDDPLPIGLDGYNPYDYNLGVYRTDLNFEMYWQDNEEKLERFYQNLEQSDYLFISSNRQWGTTTRVPERYPLTTKYYRELLGCPIEKDIVWCFSVAEPGMFIGNLGFELIQVFQSNPRIGPLEVNSQFAEEAFTVYDHPKVMIFKKTDQFNPTQLRETLGDVDLTYTIHLTPRKAADYPGNLLLPEDQLGAQRSGGTWSDIFNRDIFFNQMPIFAVIIWYLTIAMIGLINFPFIRLVFSGLDDRGYPIIRLAGMLFLAFLVWMIGSLGGTFNRGTIGFVLILMLILNMTLFMMDRRALIDEIKRNWRYYLLIEIIFLVIFIIGLGIRAGNPDLWHPYKGGEKPMDFSYFNAVIKSSSFPPYDPWFAGGYINYYYFGFVLVGVPVKLLGIMPSIAYNLILPTLLAVSGTATFCIGWNLVRKKTEFNSKPDRKRIAAGGITTLNFLFFGSLGTVRMFWDGFQKLVADIPIDEGHFFQRLGWTFEGLFKFIGGEKLPYGPGDWYWIPSRAIPGEPITEFPFFTFLYADLHAHLIALPITLLALVWIISVLKGQFKWEKINGIPKGWLTLISLLIGGLIIGSLRPINTWDLPVYLTLGALVILYVVIRHADQSTLTFIKLDFKYRKILFGILLVVLFVSFTWMLYTPFSDWYGQGYTSVKYWEGNRTPLYAYLAHWGVFYFMILTWLAWETRDWMAKTPLSALKKLKPYQNWFLAIFIIFIALVVGLLYLKVKISWFVLLIGLWALLLILRTGQPNLKRFVLFLVGTAVVLTFAVEMIVLEGDIGRMNTVFKFYLQSWTLLSISASIGLVWLIEPIRSVWGERTRNIWLIVLALMLGSAALFPLLAGADKIRDRMNKEAPHSLDGMTFMAYTTHYDNGVEMDLRQDYDAIQWMQDNVEGSPVILEANVTEYRWGNRFTVYTGLPGVVGWNWHQRQQRAVTQSTWVTDRVADVTQFYNTSDVDFVMDFIDKYDVSYIIVGQLEKANYLADGMTKFEEWKGVLWEKVYSDQDTTIYEVRK